ncbi:hypothetical protein IMG5_119930, partial [Ichthyophthirius multifiliis]
SIKNIKDLYEKIIEEFNQQLTKQSQQGQWDDLPEEVIDNLINLWKKNLDEKNVFEETADLQYNVDKTDQSTQIRTISSNQQKNQQKINLKDNTVNQIMSTIQNNNQLNSEPHKKVKLNTQELSQLQQQTQSVAILGQEDIKQEHTGQQSSPFFGIQKDQEQSSTFTLNQNEQLQSHQKIGFQKYNLNQELTTSPTQALNLIKQQSKNKIAKQNFLQNVKLEDNIENEIGENQEEKEERWIVK